VEPARKLATTRVCRKCNRELPLTAEWFRPTEFGPAKGFRGSCRKCGNERIKAVMREKTAIAQAVKRHGTPGQFTPQIVGSDDPGDFTERTEDGYRFVCLPDSHGHLIDHEAAEAALAFVRYYKPVRVYLLGDHVDFTGLSRFVSSPDERFSVRDDITACQSFLAKVRESAPKAAIMYLKGNHEARLKKYLWSKAAELEGIAGLDVPSFLQLSEYGIEWEESGHHEATEALLVKHGNFVRVRSGYTATAELERSGISGISGHTHRLAQVHKRNRLGMHTWIESGCLCKYDPPYMEGQTSDWQHGLSYGAINLKGNGFSACVAPIINGKVRAGDRAISA
jgi:hypothetical protein